jgi:hypothetical protein
LTIPTFLKIHKSLCPPDYRVRLQVVRICTVVATGL